MTRPETDVGGLLLRWASELGSGSLAELKRGAAWLARSENLPVAQGAAGRWIRDCQSLGHLDVDWRSGRWCVAPGVLTRLPSADGLAALAGSRTIGFEEHVRRAESEDLALIRVPSTLPETDIPVPETWLVPYGESAGLAETAEALGVEHSGCFAIQAAAWLPALAPGPSAAAPAFRSVVEKYCLTAEPPAFAPVRRWEEDGLYRFRRDDHRLVCQILREGSWYGVSQERGVYLELDRLGTEPRKNLRWFQEEGQGRERFGRLIVDWGKPLPDLQRRIAVMCTALPPEFGKKYRTITYRNVPRAVAERIAESLRQELGGRDD
ncbi:hypothetical protein [Streptomyces auratus]|uniref:Uncharacterized protein n=1 Tax=Streptomyces auratus AGR0001 TaxID=1160718 RepID=J1ZWA8_9ACTN|nr:hypothetical protein [Streptomyces auratus]QTZ92740.1 hypothetical protein SU9_015675 [Streptomyces auratus AGR0001]